MQTAFVIGGAGFVGQHLVRHLAAHGMRVLATCRSTASASPVNGVEWVPSDLAATDASKNWPTHYDALIYLAQSPRWRDFPAAADDIVRVNVCALQQAAEHARHAGAKRFIHMSTGTVYSQTREPAREDEPIRTDASRSFYAATKLAAELLVAPYYTSFGVTQLRLFMPYGSGQNDKMLLPAIVSKVRSGMSVDLHGADGLRCNPVAVDDVSEVVRRCLMLDGSQTLNVAGPEVLTLRQVADAIGKTIGREPRFNSKPESPPVIVGDTSRLRATLGWQPPTRFVDGVRDWLKSLGG
ncbi:MAG TPA: NAD(P)-dependent oxidoreductase [Gemmataceae bacterium]|jgi:nucleoside-diphosphate-sugar epimerase|nr:NAD(P)-dependent oxidoreductase [Gemmataceae bacterium]